MYGFDIEMIKDDNEIGYLFLVNDEYVSVEWDGNEYDYCVLSYNDDNKLEYVSELNEKWNEKECNFIREFVYKNYIN